MIFVGDGTGRGPGDQSNALLRFQVSGFSFRVSGVRCQGANRVDTAQYLNRTAQGLQPHAIGDR